MTAEVAAEAVPGSAAKRPLPRRYHAAVWSEPLVMELGRPSRRGVFAPEVEPAVAELAGRLRHWSRPPLAVGQRRPSPS